MTRTIEQINKEIRDCESLIDAAKRQYNDAMARAFAAAESGDEDARSRAWYASETPKRDLDTTLKFRREGLEKELMRAQLPRIRYTPSTAITSALAALAAALDAEDFPEDGKYGPGTFDPQSGEWLPEPRREYTEWREERDALANAIARWQEAYDE